MKKRPKIGYVYWGHRIHPRREMCAKHIGAEFHQLKNSRFHPYGEMAKSLVLAAKLARKNYDAILVDSIVAMECAYLLKKILRKKTKVILYVVDPMFDSRVLENKRRRWFHTTLGSAADAFMVPSKMNEEATKKVFPHAAIGYGPAFLWRGTKSFTKIKPDLKNKRMIFIGTKRDEKNIDSLVPAYESLAKKQHLPELFLLGMGTEEFTRDCGITGLGHTKIAPYLEKSTFLIHPARFDSAPNVIIEAMAAGVIPVVSKNCGNYDVVERIDKKLVFTDISPKGIAKKMKEIQKYSSKEIQRLSKRARTISKDFSKEKGLKTFKDSFFSLLK